MLLLATTVQADYLLTRTYLNETCDGNILYQRSTAVNLCQHNSYQPGTYRLECKDQKCMLNSYQSADCSGSAVTQKTMDASGQCTDVIGSYATFLVVSDANARQGFSTPLLTQWQDEDCNGTPVEYIDEGVCHSVGGNSYRNECLNGTINQCQYTKSTDCNSQYRSCVPAPGEKIGVCTPRGRLGGKASIQYDC